MLAARVEQSKMPFDAKAEALIDDVLNGFEQFDLVPEGIEASNQTSTYARRHRHEYVRTVHDIARHFEGRSGIKVLEIGAFFGVVSIALARAGYDVTASDVPEYMSLEAQKRRFAAEKVEIMELRLEDFIIDTPDASFDCVIMCEVLEHLNFNPLPLIKEINRVLVGSGLFYLALPNQAQINNRIRAVRGEGVGVPVNSFFLQLDKTSPLIANDHWREYTMGEINSLILPMNFSVERQYYFSKGETQNSKRLRKVLDRTFYRMFPPLKENQTHMFIKKGRTELELFIPGTVHRTLNSL
jgi:2-polyprenyl-3-methyl-5-hydroxy-6-metoxy-1,4-benzoquinol methylase